MNDGTSPGISVVLIVFWRRHSSEERMVDAGACQLGRDQTKWTTWSRFCVWLVRRLLPGHDHCR